MDTQRRSDALAVRYGWRWGLAASVLGLGSGALTRLFLVYNEAFLAPLLCCVPVIFIVWVLGVPGYQTAQHTGTLGSGAFAGALAGAFGSVGFSLGGDITLFVMQPSVTHAVVGVLVGGIVGLIENAFVFVGMGALCSLVGASMSKGRAPERVVQPVPPLPSRPPEGPHP